MFKFNAKRGNHQEYTLILKDHTVQEITTIKFSNHLAAKDFFLNRKEVHKKSPWHSPKTYLPTISAQDQIQAPPRPTRPRTIRIFKRPLRLR